MGKARINRAFSLAVDYAVRRRSIATQPVYAFGPTDEFPRVIGFENS